jgi:hypothetical protein
VKKRELIGDVLNLRVVGDHVALQPDFERLSKIGRRID